MARSAKEILETLYHSYNGATGAQLPIDDALRELCQLVKDEVIGKKSHIPANALGADSYQKRLDSQNVLKDDQRRAADRVFGQGGQE